MKGAEREGEAASRMRDKKAQTPRNESSLRSAIRHPICECESRGMA